MEIEAAPPRLQWIPAMKSVPRGYFLSGSRENLCPDRCNRTPKEHNTFPPKACFKVLSLALFKGKGHQDLLASNRVCSGLLQG